MKRMSRILMVALLAVTIGMVWTLDAKAFSLDSTSGYIKIKLVNVEMADNPLPLCPTAALGGASCTGLSDGFENSWGIAKVTSIYDQADLTTAIWQDGDGGEELTIIYYDFDYDSIHASGPKEIRINSVGGFFDLYVDNTPDFDISQGPGDRVGTTGYVGATDGTLLVHAGFDPGIVAGDLNTTFTATQANDTFPATGSAAGFASALSGSMAGLFDGNAYNNGNSDFFVQMDFRLHPDQGGTDYGWDLNSDDPILTTVPEPGTIILLGSGLVAIGVAARRRKKS